MRDVAAGDVNLRQHPAAEDMAVGVDVGGRRDDAQDRVVPLWQILDAVGHGCRSGSSLNGSSIASSWPLPLDRTTRTISAAPTNTARPNEVAVAMLTWAVVDRERLV